MYQKFRDGGGWENRKGFGVSPQFEPDLLPVVASQITLFWKLSFFDEKEKFPAANTKIIRMK